MDFRTTGDGRVHSVKCCVLFDPADGTIRHTHRVVTMEGANEASDRDVEKRARELAKSFGLKTSTLRPLHVDAGDFEPGKHYAVDPKTRRLVAITAPQRAAGNATPKPARRGRSGK
jgi:hypothetical protein